MLLGEGKAGAVSPGGKANLLFCLTQEKLGEVNPSHPIEKIMMMLMMVMIIIIKF